MNLQRSATRTLSPIDPIKLEHGELGPPEGWPSSVWIVSYATGEHGAFCYNGTNGLAFFRFKDNCGAFALTIKNPPSRAITFEHLTFEQARQLTKEKAEASARWATPITAMLLLDASPVAVFFVA